MKQELIQLSSERIPQDSTPQAPTVGNKPEKQQRMGATEGKDVISNAAQGQCLILT